MNTTLTEVKTTVFITWTDAQVVRITANKDLPEFGIRARQVVYLVRSNSLNEGHEGEGSWYRIIVWGDRKATGWSCPCKGFETYGRCHHVQKANAHSRIRAKRIATQKAIQEQARQERMIQYRVASFCEALYVHAMNEVIHQPVMQVVAAHPSVEKLVKVAPKMEPRRYCDSCQCALPLKQVNGKRLCEVCASHAITKEDAPLQWRGFQVINGIPMR